MRGFYGIGQYQPKMSSDNFGTIARTAKSFGANLLFTIGRKYTKQSSDTCNATSTIPYFHWETFDELLKNRPRQCRVVAIELSPNARKLNNFCHPEQAIYILGNEGYGIHDCVLQKCDFVVEIPMIGPPCLNVAVAASMVMYDRFIKSFINEKIV